MIKINGKWKHTQEENAKTGKANKIKLLGNTNGFKKGNVPWMSQHKGKTYTEIFGKEKADLINNKRRIASTGKKHTIKNKNKMSKIKLKQYQNPTWNEQERKSKLRINRQKQILQNGGGPNIGRNEKQILDQCEKTLGKKIKRQYPVEGYFLDGYCKEENIAFEVDEKYHNKQAKKDNERQQIIENKLNCNFVRIQDNDIHNYKNKREDK